MMATLAALAVERINVAHWNPHWECFAKEPTCKSNAVAALTDLLKTGCTQTGCAEAGLDFASVIEFEVANYTPPAGWAAIGAYQSCGHDWATLFYNTEKWTPSSEGTVGCLAAGRSFASAEFVPQSAAALTHLESGHVTVVAAHFPQTQHNATAYAEATRTLQATVANATNLLLMADTNTEGPAAAAAHPFHNSTGGVNKTNAALLSDIFPSWKPADEPPAAPLFTGCCCTPFGPWDTPFSWQGDRIVATFGTPAASRHLFDPAPRWACSDELRKTTKSEFHKGVFLELEL